MTERAHDNIVDKLIDFALPYMNTEVYGVLFALLPCVVVGGLILYFMVFTRRRDQVLERQTLEKEWSALGGGSELQAKGFELCRVLTGGIYQNSHRSLMGSLRPIEAGNYTLTFEGADYVVQMSAGSLFVMENGKQLALFRLVGRLYAQEAEFRPGYRVQLVRRFKKRVHLYHGDALVGVAQRQSFFSDKYLVAVHPDLKAGDRVYFMMLASFNHRPQSQ